MQKIDRLGWAEGISIHAYGRRIGVRTNEPSVLDRIEDLLPPGWEPGVSPLVDHLFSLRVGKASPRSRVKNYHLLYGGFTLHARSLDLEEVLRALESRMHLYVGEYASNRVFIHAGVVGWRGQAILLPGPSCAGKTTLVTALLRAGARYFSDEYAVLGPNGLVHPFPRRLSIRSSDDTASRRCGPEEFSSSAGEIPLPVGLVAVAKYVPGARWRPRALTPGQGILALLENTLSAQLDPEGALRVLEKAVASALILDGKRGEAAEVAESLLAILDGAPSAARPVRTKSSSPGVSDPSLSPGDAHVSPSEERSAHHPRATRGNAGLRSRAAQRALLE
jgi:hypothetical protein